MTRRSERDAPRNPALPARRDCLRWLGAAGAAAVTCAPLRLSATPLERVRERGPLTVGIYHDTPPVHGAGKGIDVALAQALAESLGVKLALLPFHADDNMNDDLRSMVWRGHYLGWGPADVLLHVPVDRPLMDANPQVSILAPYCRDRVAIARRLEQVPRLRTLSQLADQKVAVPGQSLPTLAPTWKEIATRYRGRDGAEDALTRTVVGGTDRTHWKGRAAFAAMLPQERWVTDTDARAIVRWILQQ